MDETRYAELLRTSRRVFGSPRDPELYWAYRFAKTRSESGSFASILAVPVSPRCKRFIPILPYDYASPSDCCYLVHGVSTFRRHAIKKIISGLLREVLEGGDYHFPVTVVTWVGSDSGARLWKLFYDIDVLPPAWLRVCFHSAGDVFP